MKEIYIRTKCSDGFEIKLTELKPYDLLFTLTELEDECRINEIDFRFEEIDDIINGLLDAKWEYVNEHGRG